MKSIARSPSISWARATFAASRIESVNNPIGVEALGALDARHAFGLVAAVVLGSLIGLERQLRQNPAGLHTNALVALGAAAYVIAGVLISDNTGPARVAGQVVTGV